MEYTVHGILQARILKWVAFSFSRDVPNPEIEPRSPALQVNSLPVEALGKPKNSGVGSLTLASRSSQPRNRTRVSYIAGGFFTNLATKEAPRTGKPPTNFKSDAYGRDKTCNKI